MLAGDGELSRNHHYLDRPFLASAEAYRVPSRLYSTKMPTMTKMTATIWTVSSVYHHRLSPVSRFLPEREGIDTIEVLNSKDHHPGFPDIPGRQSTHPKLAIPRYRVRNGRYPPIKGKAYALPPSLRNVRLRFRATDISLTLQASKVSTFDMEEEEIGHYFPEIFKVSIDCRYGNCTHRHEPGCAGTQAVESTISANPVYASI